MDEKIRHPVLFGEYPLTIDEKNRLLVPSEIRRSIPAEYGEALYIGIGRNRVPWLWPEKYYEELATRIPADMSPNDDRLAFDQLMFAMTSKVAWDKQGRILVPDRTLKRASVGRDVTVLGVRDHLELWNRDAWEARRDELEAKAAEVLLLGR